MEDNIFEASRKQSQFQKNKASQGHPEKDVVKKNKENTRLFELKEMLEKMHEMKKDLEDKLSYIYLKGKQSKIDASLLVNDARDLTRKQLEKMEEEEKKLIEKINAIIPPNACLKKTPKSKEKMTQELKGKMRGARNNWIPMR